MNPTNRTEAMLNAIAEGDNMALEPKTRLEYMLAKIANDEEITLEPVNRTEAYLKLISQNGVGVKPSEPVLQNKTITVNGTYKADAGYDGLGTVTVNVASGGVSCKYLNFYRGTITNYSTGAKFKPVAELTPKARDDSFYISTPVTDYYLVGTTARLTIGTEYPVSQFGI